MREQNKTTARIKRAKLQQSIISVCCMLLLVSTIGWMVNFAVNKNDIQTTDGSSATVEADVKSNESKEDSKDSEKNNDENNADNNSPGKNEGSQQDNESQPDSESTAKEEDTFEDAAFIGDSRTVGLMMNTDKPKASFYASIGLNISSAFTDKVITLDNGNKGTVLEAVAQRRFNRVYIMFGINELAWPYPEVFEEKYEELIIKVKELQPDAIVYAQSILPVSYLAANTNVVFTNENIDSFNEYVKQAAANTGAVYLDVGAAFKDENGSLPVEASTDGIHLIRDYCMQWMDFLADNS